MFQPETFNLTRIALEISWARHLGMNTMRIFLHDLLFLNNPSHMLESLDAVLNVTASNGIRPIIVFFDSCWRPNATAGPQLPPIPHTHNSRWVQSPNASTLVDAKQHARLREYVTTVIAAHKEDHRVLMWDLWNEPNNQLHDNRGFREAHDKLRHVDNLLPQVFQWARQVNPMQPLTTSVWREADLGETLTVRQTLGLVDVVTFHTYMRETEFAVFAGALSRLTRGRPLICTEWLARPEGSTVMTILPLAKRLKIGAVNWGLVNGRSQTNYPWDSWERKVYRGGPGAWFHDLLWENGTAYREVEVEMFRRLTKASSPYYS
ncbi:hypothetical protein HK101_007552 [Irineochytrium annulatum]|nr:hypothetical protein HK101_007552 [Irineochytrium annulatum]